MFSPLPGECKAEVADSPFLTVHAKQPNLAGSNALMDQLPVVPSVFLYLSITIVQLWTSCGPALGHSSRKMFSLLQRHFLVDTLKSVRLCFAIVCCPLSRVDKPHN